MSAEPNPLWAFAVSCYARPGVAEQLLVLQDEHDADVMLLLAAAWCAGEGRVVDTRVASQWRRHTRTSRRLICTHRQLRRELRTLGGDSGIYRAAKSFEQQLEQWQSEQLLPLATAAKSGEQARLSANLLAVMPAAAEEATADLLAELVRRIGGDAAG